MATIGTFKKTGNELTGEIVTLSLQAKNVRIVSETARSGENSPSHRVYVGRVDYAEFGIMRSGAAGVAVFGRLGGDIAPHNIDGEQCGAP